MPNAFRMCELRCSEPKFAEPRRHTKGVGALAQREEPFTLSLSLAARTAALPARPSMIQTRSSTGDLVDTSD